MNITVAIFDKVIVSVTQENFEKLVPSLGGEMMDVGGRLVSRQMVGQAGSEGAPVPPPKPGSHGKGAGGEESRGEERRAEDRRDDERETERRKRTEKTQMRGEDPRKRGVTQREEEGRV